MGNDHCRNRYPWTTDFKVDNSKISDELKVVQMLCDGSLLLEHHLPTRLPLQPPEVAIIDAGTEGELWLHRIQHC